MKIAQTIGISVLILAVGIGGFIVLGQKPEVPTASDNAREQAVPVVTAAVQPWDQPFNVDLDGEAVTYRVVTVGAEVEGRIVSKSDKARGGTYVKKGEVLFEIDDTNYQLEVERLKAQLVQTDEELKSITVDQENTDALIKLATEELVLQQNQLARMKALAERGTANDTEVESAMKMELTSRNTLLTLKNQQKNLQQQVRTNKAARGLVETQLARAEVDLKRCKVISPLEGRTVDDLVEEGAYVKSGEVLVHISDSARMEIKTKLRATELAWIWQQRTGTSGGDGIPKEVDDPLDLPRVACEVAYEFEGVETIWDGFISRIEGTGMDRDTRTFPCRVLVEEPRETRFNDSAGGRATVSPPTLLSGMFVTIRIPVTSPFPLLRVPLDSIRPGGQLWVCRDSRLMILDVKTANIEGENALLRRAGSGLRDDDRVIISPLASVRDKMLLDDTTSAENAATSEIAESPVDTQNPSPEETIENQTAQEAGA